MDWYVTAYWTDARQREKVLILCQYDCVLIPGPHSFSSLTYGREGEAEKCHTCFASRHDNKDHPSQRRSGRWWEANMCSLKSFTKCPPPSASPRARPSPLLAVHSLLVHRHQRFFYLREPFSAAVWFKFPHQRGKPLIALLNEALNPQLLPWNYPASTSKSLQTFRGWMKFKHITLFSHVPPLFARCAAGLLTSPNPSSLVPPDRLEFITTIPDLLSPCIWVVICLLAPIHFVGADGQLISGGAGEERRLAANRQRPHQLS